MHRGIKKLIGLLRLEFDDMEEDLRLMEEIALDRYKRAEITEYVLKENNALFESEIRGIQSMARLLDDPRWEGFDDEQIMLEQFDQAVRKYISDYLLPPAIHGLLSRKMTKVRQFVCE
ncbi:hypothetical protein [Spirochaeta lutea]|uniref:Uncharacterized protein n=1 Tax=Spirochaeta lutea TaxID=1480694 RepID=A0A098QV50_9SPIO|nr:hypothetical protein [Spirochaeta lutea]KGE71441.1 hypothetical protein DC28_11670 [Spirochaeta lutea]